MCAGQSASLHVTARCVSAHATLCLALGSRHVRQGSMANDVQWCKWLRCSVCLLALTVASSCPSQPRHMALTCCTPSSPCHTARAAALCTTWAHATQTVGVCACWPWPPRVVTGGPCCAHCALVIQPDVTSGLHQGVVQQEQQHPGAPAAANVRTSLSQRPHSFAPW